MPVDDARWWRACGYGVQDTCQVYAHAATFPDLRACDHPLGWAKTGLPVDSILDLLGRGSASDEIARLLIWCQQGWPEAEAAVWCASRWGEGLRRLDSGGHVDAARAALAWRNANVSPQESFEWVELLPTRDATESIVWQQAGFTAAQTRAAVTVLQQTHQPIDPYGAVSYAKLTTEWLHLGLSPERLLLALRAELGPTEAAALDEDDWEGIAVLVALKSVG